MKAILHYVNKNLLQPTICQFCTVPAPNYAQQYRKILMKLNAQTLRNQVGQMRRLSKSQTIKMKKMQLIDNLCTLQQSIIQKRVYQLQSKSLYQLTTGVNLSVEGEMQAQLNRRSQPVRQKQLVEDEQCKRPQYEQNLSNETVLGNSLKKMMNNDILRLWNSQKLSNYRIMDALYRNWAEINAEKLERQNIEMQKSTQNSTTTQKQQKQKQKQNQQSNTNAKNNLQYVISPEVLHRLKRKPFVNRLFKTNQHLLTQEQKRKYFYEYDKSDIVELIIQGQPSARREFEKNIWQVVQQRQDNQLMRGFVLNYSKAKYKWYFKRKEWILHLLVGFNYYKQLVTNPHLVQFIFALTFDRELPVEYTIFKIVQEYLQCPLTFRYNIIAISKEHFLKFLRASANYILKVFKKSDGMGGKKDIVENFRIEDKNSIAQEQDQSEDRELDDEDQTEEQQYQTKHKEAAETQKLPKSRQYIDLELMQFAFAIFQGGIERIVTQLTTNKQVLLQKGSIDLSSLSKDQKKQLKATHQTLMLCCQIYKTMQSLFFSIQINDFNDLNRLSHVLTIYHKLRQYLSSNIHIIEQFMRNYDKHYQQKFDLGLSNIITAKELSQGNFVLKNQARKLNFQIIDNINSMLKHDNVQITLQNRRDKIFGVMERFFKVYIENGMMDFLEDQLIYTIVRFLQKEVYLDKKVKSLFQARVHFDSTQQQPKEVKKQNKKDSKVTQTAQKQSSIEYTFNPSYQYDFGVEPTSTPTYASPSFSWFQLQSIMPTQQPSSQQTFAPFITQKTQKSHYFMGKISQLLPKELLYYLITIIKYKHDRKQIEIQPIHGFNLIQQWYSEPHVVRLQFLKEEIIERYKRLKENQTREKIEGEKRKNSRSFHEL